MSGAEGELADEELDSVAGGCSKDEAIPSVIPVGVGCLMNAIESAAKGDMNGPDGSILCNVYS